MLKDTEALLRNLVLESNPNEQNEQKRATHTELLFFLALHKQGNNFFHVNNIYISFSNIFPVVKMFETVETCIHHGENVLKHIFPILLPTFVVFMP